MLTLTTEHFTLQTARSATITETNGRSTLFLGTVSSGVVALAFIGQVAGGGELFFLFALALLPALLFLGLVTYLRLVQSAIEDLLYALAINRIRSFYLGLDPAAPSWLLLGGNDDLDGVMASMGLARSRGHLLSHTASMVAVITSIISGVFAALVIGTLSAGRIPVRVTVGISLLASLSMTAALWGHQTHHWRTAEHRVPARFPSASQHQPLPQRRLPRSRSSCRRRHLAGWAPPPTLSAQISLMRTA